MPQREKFDFGLVLKVQPHVAILEAVANVSSVSMFKKAIGESMINKEIAEELINLEKRGPLQVGCTTSRDLFRRIANYTRGRN